MEKQDKKTKNSQKDTESNKPKKTTKSDLAKARIIELTKYLNELNNAYYNLDNPIVEDYIYDQLLRELEELEIKYPNAIQPDSPTTKIGGVPSIEFEKYTHQKPMLSLAKAYNFEEIEKFVADIKSEINRSDIEFNLEPKIDGLSISLIYQNGKLIRAVTRGDGKVGEDVTKNAILIRSIPKNIPYEKDIEIRGEIYVTKDKLIETNAQLEAEYEAKVNQYYEKLQNSDQNKKISMPKLQQFANTRNMASGTLRQKSSKLLIQRDLRVLMYDIVNPLEHNIYHQNKILDFIKELGLPTHEYGYVENASANIINRINEFENYKDKFQYDCDGFVIKLNQLQYWDLLGKTAKFPKYAIAYKYKTEEAYPIVSKIETTVGRTGKITYVAEFQDAVELNQTMVKKATLHNYDFIKNLNLNIGDQVVVIKSGEIIPKIIDMKQKNTLGVFPKVLYCPACNSQLVEIQGIVDQFCENEECQSKYVKKLIHFVSRKALNIMTLGDKIIEALFDAGIITDFISIFNLKNKREEMIQTLLMNPKSNETGLLESKKVDKILESIEISRNVELYKVIYGLGIKNIGLEVAKLIANEINNLTELINLNLETLLEINTIGPEIIESLKIYLSDDNNKKQLELLEQELKYIKEEKNTQTELLKGLSFAVTGKMAISREEMWKIIEDNSGIVHKAVTKKTNYLVYGQNVGDTKLQKANELGTKIISEDEFFEMIDRKALEQKWK
ncbi:NAD-dependent DNA ligase LigA [Mycoplasmopsis verecunda]|uniref:DNA ligase n=1 Tax=Mycoplasmopsis verecunda TaxID=171291 RepID=A0A1T4LZV7_9BACT|nr:NAD-dependent DNA ligase LigA [Mycoplasmopsis verecunda]WPB54595.1 NAD-dependent DNA ligase LigA [Mycoplasmopsis verecunda]SJZ60185.1 DNA ligase (NAD+) [Mycoplasmopsis verecunda]